MVISKMPTKSLLKELVERKVLLPKDALNLLHGGGTTNLQEEANKWISKHHDMYEYMEKAALKLLQDKQSFGPRLLSEEARCFSKANGQTFKIANALVSYVIKRIIEKHPGISTLVKFKRDKR